MKAYPNLIDLVIRHCDSSTACQLAICAKNGRGRAISNTGYSGLTYPEVFALSSQFAMGITDLGIKTDDRVGIFSFNCQEWVIADMGTLMSGIINVPIYPTLSGPEVAYIINDSGMVAIVAQTQDHIRLLESIAPQCPNLRFVIHIVPTTTWDIPAIQAIQFDSLLEIGHHGLSEEHSWLESVRAIPSNAIASIVYTSGTTGNPKGVCLTHANIQSNVEDLLAVTPLNNQDVVLSFLPLSHVFERTVGYYTLLAIGGTIFYAENMNSVAQDMLIVHPTIMISVPRLYEKIQIKIRDNAVGIKRHLLAWAMRQRAESTGWKKCQYWVANTLVFQKIKQKMGGKIRFLVSGGAPLPRQVADFFYAIGLLIIEGYGLTETAPVIACNRVDDFKFGTVGKSLPSQTVTCAPDGELIIKGPNVTPQYWNRPELKSELMIDNEWCRTGDIATIDKDGFITIIDRKKELIVLSNGKKVPPQDIEKRMLTSPLISQALAIGDGHSYLTALIVPNFSALEKILGHKLVVNEGRQILDDPQVNFIYEKEISAATADMANYEKVKKFTVLTNEWSPQTGELTPTLKPKRKVIISNFKSDIEKMYN